MPIPRPQAGSAGSGALPRLRNQRIAPVEPSTALKLPSQAPKKRTPLEMVTPVEIGPPTDVFHSAVSPPTLFGFSRLSLGLKLECAGSRRYIGHSWAARPMTTKPHKKQAREAAPIELISCGEKATKARCRKVHYGLPGYFCMRLLDR